MANNFTKQFLKLGLGQGGTFRRGGPALILSWECDTIELVAWGVEAFVGAEKSTDGDAAWGVTQLEVLGGNGKSERKKNRVHQNVLVNYDEQMLIKNKIIQCCGSLNF